LEEGDRPELKTLHCSNLTKEIDSLTKDGYRLDMIMPADSPREALLSKNGEAVRLINPKSKIPNRKSDGRAGMEYRDLIPNRLGGRVIASHIRITKGGEVPDYVHYHKINFQMIYCKSGWIRVVYEDQGEPFVLEAGDCILQPPEIRHRVLESSAGAEVIEVSSPAEHETWVEHEIELPTVEINRDRDFSGQKFVRHVSREAQWTSTASDAVVAETEIKSSTKGVGCVRILKIAANGAATGESGDALVFLYVLSGTVRADALTLRVDDKLVLTDRHAYSLKALEDSEILEVRLSNI